MSARMGILIRDAIPNDPVPVPEHIPKPQPIPSPPVDPDPKPIIGLPPCR